MYYIIIIHRVNINLPIHLQRFVNFELDRFMIFKAETLPKIYQPPLLSSREEN